MPSSYLLSTSKVCILDAAADHKQKPVEQPSDPLSLAEETLPTSIKGKEALAQKSLESPPPLPTVKAIPTPCTCLQS
eukprot:1153703-Pelagomonas_calceolata.AAC.1